jgi:hypothetical protein
MVNVQTGAEEPGRSIKPDAPADPPPPGTDFYRAWQIYDEHRSALFNSGYFEAKVSRIQSASMFLDIVIAIGTSTTGIAGWALWNEAGFKVIWIVVAGVAGTLAVVKPILNLQEQLVRVTKLFGQYGQLARGYSDLVGDMGAQQRIDADVVNRFNELRKTATTIELVPQGPRRLLLKVQNDVNREWPITRYWSPPKPAIQGA